MARHGSIGHLRLACAVAVVDWMVLMSTPVICGCILSAARRWGFSRFWHSTPRAQ
jgi:hypothetical protein